ncbi:MAG: NADP-dependent oxidoreductase [Halorientalis sp.]
MAPANRKWIFASRPSGTPDHENFELQEEPIPEPGPKELLLRTLYMSVDPYMRGRMRDTESYAEPWEVGDVMQCGVVAEVVESNHPDWERGDVVNGRLEWAEYIVADPSADDLRSVDPSIAPVSTALGVVGMPGRTAYFGLLEAGDPSPGDTLVVSGAAGAVGSVVGQIGKLAGCEVVGIAGADEKVEWLTEDLGFDAGINYKTEDVPSALDEHCPEGIDVYFDNVGGPITDAVFERLALDARVVVCGQIALYNQEGLPTGPRKLWSLIRTRATVEGILVSDYATRFEEATQQLGEWVSEGTLRYRENVVDGIENAPDAFLGLFEGVNVGKQLVKVADPEYADL